MKFPVVIPKYSTLLKVFLWLIVAFGVATTVFSILTLCDVYTFLNLSYVQAKILIVTHLITSTLCIALATMHYKVETKHLRLKIAFFDILSGRIRIENILNVVYSQGKMYVSYIWQGNDPVIASILISPKKFDTLKDLLMQQNKGIVFYEDDKNEIGNC